MNRIGKNTILFNHAPVIISAAGVVGKKEGEGPLKSYFDKIYDDNLMNETSWEKAESGLQTNAVLLALQKAQLSTADIDCIFAGDLLNQCIGTTFGMRDLNIPLYGQYGACSTMAQTLSMAAMLVDGMYATHTLAVTSSHFCTAERQFRFPLEYGSLRTPTSQWTVCGCGAFVLSAQGEGPCICEATTGKIVDLGIKDMNNMGAAMAPAAADTIHNYLRDTGRKPEDFDMILTGDLGYVGSKLLQELMQKEYDTDISPVHQDCGKLIFDAHKQGVDAGGSGCGCSASVLSTYIYTKMKKRELNDILFVATGALMSLTSSKQGESIPSIAHLVRIKANTEE